MCQVLLTWRGALAQFLLQVCIVAFCFLPLGRSPTTTVMLDGPKRNVLSNAYSVLFIHSQTSLQSMRYFSCFTNEKLLKEVKLFIQSLLPGKCGIGTGPAPFYLTPKSGWACFSLIKLPLGAQKAPGGSGAEEASKGPHTQGTRLIRVVALAPQGLVPSSHAGSGAAEHCKSNRLGPASVGSPREQAGGAVAPHHGPSAVSAAVCIS